MKFQKLGIFVHCLAVMGFSACNAQDLNKRFQIKLDRSLTSSEIQNLRSDVSTLGQMKIAAQPKTAFDAVFKGTDSQAILSYLDERVNYVISKDVQMTSRMVEMSGYTSDTGEASDNGSTGPMRYAMNMGTLLWMYGVGNHRSIGFRMNNQVVPVRSSRIGLIQLGPGYSLPHAIAAERMATLVHEARHSDCTGGLKVSDAEAFVQTDKDPNIPHECGHMHAICPEGHEFAGAFACDAHPWGAYSIEAIYEAAIAYQCSNCDETTKQVALAAMHHSFSRVLVDTKAMVRGELGLPNMSSSGVRADADR